MDPVGSLSSTSQIKMLIMCIWSLSCDPNKAEEAGSSLYEWLSVYTNWGAAVVKNWGITICDQEM